MTSSPPFRRCDALSSSARRLAAGLLFCFLPGAPHAALTIEATPLTEAAARSLARFYQRDSGRTLTLAAKAPLAIAEGAAPSGGKPLGHLAVAVIVNGRNPLEKLGRDELLALYAKADAGRWTTPGARPGPRIRLIGAPGSASRQLFDRAIGLDKQPAAPAESFRTVSGALSTILFVGIDPLTIGYASASIVRLALAEGGRIRTIAIDGIEPSPANIENGQYPMATPVHLRVGGSASGEVLHFLSYLTSPEGQQALREAGITPRGDANGASQ